MKRSFLLLFLLLCFLLAACGNSPTPTPPAVPNSNPTSSSNSSSSNTSTSANEPTMLHITRTDLAATNSLGPLDKMITDVATVQKLYQMGLALPAYATQNSISQSCMNDYGLIYHLEFLRGSTEVQLMNLDPSSCQVLYVSQTDLRQVNSAFLTYFKQAVQVSSLT